jgi:hypothetical protein
MSGRRRIDVHQHVVPPRHAAIERENAARLFSEVS